jgi:hypothetical protein
MFSAILAAHAPEFDLGRVVFIIMVLIGGFLQWATNWWKKKQAEVRANAQRKKMQWEARESLPTSSAEEAQAREEAWRRQVGADDGSPAQPAARHPLEDLLKTFREFAGSAIEEPPPAVTLPPPNPAAQPRAGLPESKAPRDGEVSLAPSATVRKRDRHPLASKLAASGGLRQAVVFREILGPPKALQSRDDHLI